MQVLLYKNVGALTPMLIRSDGLRVIITPLGINFKASLDIKIDF
jgi:hypothetical protein